MEINKQENWEDLIIDDILKNIKELNIKNWPVCIQDRSKWKSFVEKFKTSMKL